MEEDDGENQATSHAQSLVGLTIKGKWRLDALIGVGGMAAVFAATHRNGDRVAVKILHPYVAVNAQLRQRFLREGYTANSVGHPGVVRVQDDDALEDGSVFLVMELLEGESLEGRWRRYQHKMPPLEVLSLMEQALDVLSAAHQKGILHRDIKPDNIFITKDNKVKILDFGIAKVKEAVSGGAEAKTRTGTMMGTPAYMSPEQVMGKAVDPTADLWAVGATMYTLMTGSFVHPAETVNEQLVLAATQAAKPFKEVVPNAPDALCELVDRALAFRREDRWQDGQTFRAAARAVMETLRADNPDWKPAVDASVSVGFAPTVDSASGAAVLSRTPNNPSGGSAGTPNQASISAATIDARASGLPKKTSSEGTPDGPRSRAPILLGVGAVALAAVAVFVSLRGNGQNQTPPSAATTATVTADAPKPSATTPAIVVAPATSTPEPAESASASPKVAVGKPGAGPAGKPVPSAGGPAKPPPPKPDGPDMFEKR